MAFQVSITNEDGNLPAHGRTFYVQTLANHRLVTISLSLMCLDYDWQKKRWEPGLLGRDIFLKVHDSISPSTALMKALP